MPYATSVPPREAGVRADARGFSLLEVLTATVIAVIAVVGLAHSFAVGRTLIDRYATARAALAFAQGEAERFASLVIHQPSDPAVGIGPHSQAITLQSRAATESWQIFAVNDPIDGTSDPYDYKSATIVVTWNYGGVTDSVTISRTLPAPGP